MRFLRTVALVFTAVALVGCPSEDVCEAGDEPTIELGQGVASAFEPYVDGQEVQIEPASQGGFGFPILIRSQGLVAGLEANGEVVMDTLVEGVRTGTWTENTPLTCDEGAGRTPSVLHVGFDSSVYRTTDDFIDLVGDTVELEVTLTDEEGNTASVTQAVVLLLGS